MFLMIVFLDYFLFKTQVPPDGPESSWLSTLNPADFPVEKGWLIRSAWFLSASLFVGCGGRIKKILPDQERSGNPVAIST